MSGDPNKNYNNRYKEKVRGNPKFRLKPDEAEIVLEYRRIRDEAVAAGINPNSIKHGWIKSKKASLFFKNPHYQKEEYDKFKEELIKELAEYSPVFSKIKRKQSSDPHLLILDPADVHIGKLCTSLVSGKEYNSQIAVQRTLEGVSGILNKTAGFNFDRIVLILGNDILHVDGPNNTTTRGTRQDVDGMWYDNFLLAKKLYVDIIDYLVNIADVYIMYNPSNHDYMSSFFLADIIKVYFKNHKNVKIDSSLQYRKYFTYGTNLIGSCHGDGTKMDTLPYLMADEAKDWSSCKYRYMFTHHVHHKIAKDYPGLSIESLRSPSGSDVWHHKMGYTSSNNAAIEGYVHHPKFGQVARITNLF